MVHCRYIIVNTLHQRENKDDDDDDDDNNCKNSSRKAEEKSVRIFQTLSHIPPVHPWAPTKWNGPVNGNEPGGKACEREKSCN
jgi:hypothetical protein